MSQRHQERAGGRCCVFASYPAALWVRDISGAAPFLCVFRTEIKKLRLVTV